MFHLICRTIGLGIPFAIKVKKSKKCSLVLLFSCTGHGDCMSLGVFSRGCHSGRNQLLSHRRRVKYARRCENKHLPKLSRVLESTSVTNDDQASPSLRHMTSQASPGNDREEENLFKCLDPHDVSGFMPCSSFDSLPSSSSLASSSTDDASSPLFVSKERRKNSIPCDPVQTNRTPWKCSTSSRKEDDFPSEEENKNKSSDDDSQ